MKSVIICRGLPASGKSSWAKEWVDKHPNQVKRINLDDLRSMFDNSHQSKGNEKFVKAMRDMLIVEALKDGKNIISDNTHLSPKSVNHIKQLVQKFNMENNDSVQVTEKFFNVPVEECIKRDLKRPNSVGSKVIMQMYNQFLAPKVELLVQDSTLPKAVLIDLDGTVAKMTTRGPFEWSRVGEDEPKTNVINIVKSVVSGGYKAIFFSGRDAVCKPETCDWIKKHFGWDVSQYSIYMRNCGDSRKDSVVKKEMFSVNIRGRYFIEAVFDDRNSVVDTWRREIGLTCMQVDYGDF